jgi:hypothetical protein
MTKNIELFFTALAAAGAGIAPAPITQRTQPDIKISKESNQLATA